MTKNGDRPRFPTCLALALGGLALAAISAQVSAQAWPSRVVRVVSTSPPGGGIDLLARSIAEDFSRHFGQPFIVETRPGGNGNIGVDLVLKQPPDGHAMFVSAIGPFAINQSLYGAMPFNPSTDIAPITMLGISPLVLVVHPSVPVRNLKELSAWMKDQGGKVNYSSQALGSTGHLAMELFKAKAGVEATHIPYKSSANEATLALISGTVQMSFVNVSTALPQAAKGTLRPIGVAELKRIAGAPDIPTLHEQGASGFEATPWLGLGTRAGVPRDIIRRLADRAGVALAAPEAAKRLGNVGMEARLMTPEEFGDYIKAETAKWADVIKRSGAKAD